MPKLTPSAKAERERCVRVLRRMRRRALWDANAIAAAPFGGKEMPLVRRAQAHELELAIAAIQEAPDNG